MKYREYLLGASLIFISGVCAYNVNGEPTIFKVWLVLVGITTLIAGFFRMITADEKYY